MKPFLTLVAMLLVGSFVLAEPATTQPAESGEVIKSSDKDALTAAMGKSVTVEGKIKSAKWSRSGAVCTIQFEDSDLLGAAFKKSKEDLDKKFDGDFAAALKDATVKLKGKIEKYGGKVEAFQDHPQIIISQSSQLTIEKPAATTEASQ